MTKEAEKVFNEFSKWAFEQPLDVKDRGRLTAKYFVNYLISKDRWKRIHPAELALIVRAELLGIINHRRGREIVLAATS